MNYNLTFDDFQSAVAVLALEARPDDSPGPALADSLIARLAEETGELARAVRRNGRQRFGHDSEPEGTASEVLDKLGDVLFLLARTARLAGVDLSDASVAVANKIRRRIEASGHGAQAG